MSNCKEIPVADFGSQMTDVFDVFIASASYEQRCLTVARNLPRDRYDVALVAGNANHMSYVGENWKQLCSLVGERCVRIEQNSNLPLIGGDAFLRAFDRLRTLDGLS